MSVRVVGRPKKTLALVLAAIALALIGARTVSLPIFSSDNPLFGRSIERSGESDAGAPAKAGSPLRILPLGDSITQADANHLGYRYSLWVKLVDAGIKFDFVGSLRDNYGGNPQWPPHKERSFDSDHEGHWGWRADQILNGLPEEENNNLTKWLKGYTPEIVLIHLGSKDVFRRENVLETEAELGQIINILRDDNPQVIILMAELIPTGSREVNAHIRELNARIAELALKANTAQSPVVIVDQYSGFNGDTDTYDRIHPNTSGEEKMAAKWFDAIRACVERRR